MAGRLFEESLFAILETTSPRAWAFALIGIHEYLQRFVGDRRVSQVQENWQGGCWYFTKITRSDGWKWFEDRVDLLQRRIATCHALCGQSIPNATAMTEVGLESLNWLTDLHRTDREGRHFIPIGSNGFYPQDGECARFDQQPVEAQGWFLPVLKLTVSLG
jgi:hypothetical protein